MIDSVNMSPQNIIQNKTKNEIDAYIATRGKSRVYEGARNLSLNVSDDYGNRFLVELIQNAHDAHPSDKKDGEISIIFDPMDTEFGCLYVANRGNGFSKNNFEAITNIALSSKSVNEDIGNKGLGFRSVLQICEWPEIYSASSRNNGFDGFCFRFSKLDDVLSYMQEGEADLAHEIMRNMPCLYLPVYEKNQPGLISNFADKGFSSVVRLPLTSQKSYVSVEKEMNAILDRTEPINLFFDRIAKVSFELLGKYKKELIHNQLQEWQLYPNVKISKVKLSEDNYLLAKYDLVDEEFREVLNKNLADGKVPKAWEDWKGGASVSVAVNLSRSVEVGLLYCFLPMGDESEAPFAGYINANFYTAMDRRSLIENVQLNDYFIERAASLSCDLIDFLIKENWPESPNAVLDLLCWEEPYKEIMLDALKEGESPLLVRPLLPVISSVRSKAWSTLQATRLIDNDNICLTPEFLSNNSDATVLCPSINESQISALKRFFQFEYDFLPKGDELAIWIEQSANVLHKTNASDVLWAHFYNDVAKVMVYKSEHLFDRKFLLNGNSELVSPQKTEEKKRRFDLFFPPAIIRDASEDSELSLESFPAALQQRFSLLNKNIPWTSEKDGCREARDFLIKSKLVREYDKSEILRTLARLTRDASSLILRKQAFEWAFKLWKSGRSLSDTDTRRVRFSVPVDGKWISAEIAMFGGGWSDALNGNKLEKFVKQASKQSDEFDIQGDFLVPYEIWAFSSGNEKEWSRFLTAIGVRDHLRIYSHEKMKAEARASDLPNKLCESTNLSAEKKLLWKSSLIQSAKRASYHSVWYQAKFDIYLIYGLLEFKAFNEETKKQFSVQLMLALKAVDKTHLQFRVSRYSDNVMYWESPLAVLIKNSPWIPVANRGSKVSFTSPSNAWVFNSDDEVSPRFIKLIIPSLTKILDNVNKLEYKKLLGYRVLNEAEDSALAMNVYLKAIENGLSDSRDVNRFKELFSNLWAKVSPLLLEDEILNLPVNIGNEISLLDQKSNTVKYYVDEENDSKINLLEELKLPYFDFNEGKNDESWALIEAIAPSQFKKLSQEELFVIIDGNRINSFSNIRTLESLFGSWFIDFLVVVAAHKGNRFFSATQKPLLKLRSTAKSLGILIGINIQVSMAGKVCALPNTLQNAVTTEFEDTPILVIQNQSSDLSFELLASAAEQFANSLGYTSLGSAFDASLLRLSNEDLSNVKANNYNQLFSKVIGVPLDKIQETLRLLRGDLSSSISYARLLAIIIANEDCSKKLAELLADNDAVNEDEVLEAITPIAIQYKFSPNTLLSMLSDIYEPRELLDVFELSLQSLNQAISECGEYTLISNENQHRQEYDAFLSQNQKSINEKVRSYFVSYFDKGQVLVKYAEIIHAVKNIPINTEWFITYDELPDSVIEAHISKYLEGKLIDEEISENKELQPIELVKASNIKILRDFWSEYSEILSTWISYTTESVSPLMKSVWSDPLAKKDEYITRANNDGWLDFRLLNEQQIIVRLIDYNIWPSDKLATRDLASWGIDKNDIAKQKKLLRQEKENAALQRTQLNMNGKIVSAVSTDLSELSDSVLATFATSNAFNNIGKDETSLKKSSTKTSDSKRSSGGGAYNNDSKMSDDQKVAVGLIGELFAKEWLSRHHKEKHGIEITDDCWVSGYRNKILSSNTGDDSLGYDFIIKLKTITYYYEVKASQGDSCTFEMGPTEITQAQKYANDKNHKYRVLYVSNALDSENVKIDFLHNPFSANGIGKIKLAGSGSIKFRFLLN